MPDVLSTHDRIFVELLSELSPEDWRAQSLCTEWTVQEVVAHVVLGMEFSLFELGKKLIHTRGSFDDASNTLVAERVTSSDPSSLLSDFKRYSERRPLRSRLFFPSRFQLGDRVLHYLDIVLALERQPRVTADAANMILPTQVRFPNPLVPSRRLAKGISFTTTDTNWTRHLRAAPEVNGSASDLISVLGGRPHALQRLNGSGVDLLRDRLSNLPAARPAAGS